MNELNLVLYNQNIWGNYGGGNSVSNRNELVCQMIKEYGADICCFQECNPNTSRSDNVDIEALLSYQYSEVPTSVKNQNFTPIFYDKDKYEVINSGYCAFPGFNDINSKSFTWCVFKDNNSEIQFGIISTHFWYKNRGEVDDLQRLENAKTVLSCVNSLKLRYDIPVFVFGDLNSGIGASTEEKTWLYMKENMLDLRDIAKVTTSAKTCHIAPVKNEQGIYDTKTGECLFTLDYMFLSDDKNVTVHSFEVDNSDYSWSSSDHCPIIAKVTIFEK